MKKNFYPFLYKLFNNILSTPKQIPGTKLLITILIYLKKHDNLAIKRLTTLMSTDLNIFKALI